VIHYRLSFRRLWTAFGSVVIESQPSMQIKLLAKLSLNGAKKLWAERKEQHRRIP